MIEVEGAGHLDAWEGEARVDGAGPTAVLNDPALHGPEGEGLLQQSARTSNRRTGHLSRGRSRTPPAQLR